MNTFWIQFGNTDAARKRFALPRLGYPLSFNLPAGAWRVEPESLAVPHDAKDLEMHIDVVAELDRDLIPSQSKPDPAWLRGFRLSVALFDRGFARHFVNASIRERGVCDYYARWGENTNALGPLWQLGWHQVSGHRLCLNLAGEKTEITIDVDLDPVAMLSFFHPFNRLAAGDQISVGTFLIESLPASIPAQLELTLDDKSWPLALTRGD
jgi:hypothetical protein